MFQGSIPADLRSLVVEATRDWTATDLYVGCSGNFTIERILADRFRLHGNDVSVYSASLGRYLAGDDPGLTIRPEYEEMFGWLSAFRTRPPGR